MALDFLIRLLTTGADAAKSDFEGVADSAKEVDGELSNVGDNDGLERAGSSAVSLGDKLEKVRNAGVALAAVGAVGLALSNQLIQVAEEGNAVEQRLESILNVQKRLNDLGTINDAIGDVTVKGHFNDDDEIRNAAVLMASFAVQTKDMGALLEMSARQARTAGIAIDGVASAMGKAYSTGQVAALKKSGVTMTDLEIAAVQAAYGISQTAGQLKFMEVVGKGVNDNTVALADSLTGAQAAANDAARGMDDAMTAAGTGAANAKIHVDSVVGSILGVVNTAPGLVESAGYFGYIGSGALTAVGSVLGLSAQVGLTMTAFPGLGLAAQGAFAQMKIAAGSTIPFLQGVAGSLAVPFAILVAGIAVGVAGYEALRAMNIGGFGDTHKSTAEIFADTRKTLMGDPAADAAAATKSAMAAAPTAPVMPAVPAPVMPTVVPAVAPVLATATPKAPKAAKKTKEPKEPPLPAGTGPGAHWELAADGYWYLDAGDGGIGDGSRVKDGVKGAAIIPKVGVATDILSLVSSFGVKGLGGKGGSTPSASKGGTAQVGSPTYAQDSSGVWWVKFPDLKLPPGASLQAAAVGYRN